MLIVKSSEELARYRGADPLNAYRSQSGFTDYEFAYACVLPEGREAIHATFRKAGPHGLRSSVDISAMQRPDGSWSCRHFVEQ